MLLSAHGEFLCSDLSTRNLDWGWGGRGGKVPHPEGKIMLVEPDRHGSLR